MVIIKLGELLEKNNMTQKELSLKAHIRPATISALVNNTWKTVSQDVLNKICKTLNCTTNELVEYRADEPETKPPTDQELDAAIKVLKEKFGVVDDIEIPKAEILKDKIDIKSLKNIDKSDKNTPDNKMSQTKMDV